MNEDKCGEENRMEWKGLNLINLVFLFLNNQLLPMHHFNGNLSLFFEILNQLIRWMLFLSDEVNIDKYCRMENFDWNEIKY